VARRRSGEPRWHRLGPSVTTTMEGCEATVESKGIQREGISHWGGDLTTTVALILTRGGWSLAAGMDELSLR
jgi:hypothetical protein